MDNNNNINSTNSQPEQLNEKKIKEQENHEASAKTAHVVGKGLSTYYGKGVGGEIYEAASKTKPVQALESQLGARTEKLTGEGGKKAMNFFNKSGTLDAADEAISAIGSGKGGNSIPGTGAKPNVNANKDILKGSPSKSASSKNKFVDGLKNTKKHRQLVTPPNSGQVSASMDDINPNDIEVPEGIEDPDAYRQEVLEQIQRERLEQQMMQEEMLREQREKEEKRKKQKEAAKKIIELIKKDPKMALIIIAVVLIVLVLFILIYMIASDMDLVGTQMTRYDQAELISNAGAYCDQIILIKEHPDFPGDAVSSIDDVDLTETFVLNRKTVNRWSTTSYDLETYINGVVQAEAINVADEKTFEVASIAARTYALQITNSKCHTWDNTNTRETYRNPQNFTTDTPDAKVTTAVNTTSGLVITLEDKLLDMENGNYYDYFCNTGKTREREDYTLYQMLQKNEEERLLIPIEWAKENNAEDAANFNRSGKYDGLCQKEGMSLFGAKYLLNEKPEVYTTLRILRYYYGHQTEIKRVNSSTLAYGCSEINMKTTSLTRDQFIQAVNNYAVGRVSIRPLSDIAGVIYDMGVQNNVNPELVFIRAAVEGYSPGGSTNNFWGIGCTNTGGANACHTYSSVTEGVLAFLQNVSQYDTLEAMMRKYAYLGDYWYNPGSSSLGGCYYAPHIYPNGVPSRVSAACSGGSCTKNGGSCTPTTDEDHHAYAMFQAKGMFERRKDIFNLESDDCENTAGTGGIVTGPGACTLWAQGDPSWSSDKLGNSSKTMSSSGCLVTAITMAMSCSGTPLTENINPKVFLNKLNANNAFSGPNYIWDIGDRVIRSIAPGFINRTDIQTNKIHNTVVSKLNQYNSSKNMIVFQINNSAHSQHWVLFKSLNGNTITVYDPAGGRINTYPTTDVVRLRVYSFS